jgi:hypothetical protein
MIARLFEGLFPRLKMSPAAHAVEARPRGKTQTRHAIKNSAVWTDSAPTDRYPDQSSSQAELYQQLLCCAVSKRRPCRHEQQQVVPLTVLMVSQETKVGQQSKQQSPPTIAVTTITVGTAAEQARTLDRGGTGPARP